MKNRDNNKGRFPTKKNEQKIGLLPNLGGGQAEEGKNQTPYENFYFAETCYTDTQTSKSWRYVKK